MGNERARQAWDQGPVADPGEDLDLGQEVEPSERMTPRQEGPEGATADDTGDQAREEAPTPRGDGDSPGDSSR